MTMSMRQSPSTSGLRCADAVFKRSKVKGYPLAALFRVLVCIFSSLSLYLGTVLITVMSSALATTLSRTDPQVDGK